MNVLVLNGGPVNEGGRLSREIRDAVAGAARARGGSVASFDLDALDIKPCRGCFACWLKHPGTCAIKDGQEPILGALAASDTVVWITPVTFGGYSAALKKTLDRSIPNALPFFTKRHGDVHHPLRYPRKQNFLVFGTLAAPDPEAERIFHNLVQRNTINLDAATTASRIVIDGTGTEEVNTLVHNLMDPKEEIR